MTFRRIMIALDESALSAHAMDVGIALAAALRAEVALIYVVDPGLAYTAQAGIPPAVLLADLKREGHALLAAAVERTGGTPPPRQFLHEGHPGREIVAAAREWEAELIVLGTHGRSGLTRVVMGSTAEEVLRHAPCPVVVVRSEAPAGS